MGYSDLTDYERQVAILIANGCSAKEIYSHFHTSRNSLDWTIRVIKQKLECRKNTEIARITVSNEMRNRCRTSLLDSS